MSTSALIGRSPIAVSRRCSQSGDGPFLHAAHEPQREAAAERRRCAEVERHRDRTGKFALHRLDPGIHELAHVGGGEVARDAVHAGAVRTVGRQVDLDHRIVEAGPLRVALADRRVGRQLDDALVIVGDLQLDVRAQHAAALDAADRADAERHVLARNVRARRHEHAVHAGARIGRAAHDLHRIAGAGIDHAHAQPVGVGMLLGRDHARDRERRQQLAVSSTLSTSSPIMVSLSTMRGERRIRVEMLLEPGEGEFHRRTFSSPLASTSPSSRSRPSSPRKSV